jgi:dihydroorotase-like cyclic amidohydrolase
MVDTVVKNAQLVTPAGLVAGGVAIGDGRIVAVATDDELPRANEQIDCGGKVVLPGLVDPHVHMGGQFPYDQNCQTECHSAAAGGVTTILQYRASKVSFLEDFPTIRATAAKHFFVDTAWHFILGQQQQIDEIPQYAKQFGVTSYKFYMGGYEPGNPIGLVCVNDGMLFSAMEHIRNLGPYAYAMVHCEDDSLVSTLTARVKVRGGESLLDYSASRPAFCEEQDIMRAVWLAGLTDCQLYVPHTTVGLAMEVENQARLKGPRLTLETCPHYLALTEHDERWCHMSPGIGKVSPPLRDRGHQDRLWWGLQRGFIKTVGSDHVPIQKTGADLWAERPGFAGLATTLPVMLSEGYHKGRLSLEKIAEVCAFNPARVFGFAPRKGAIRVGADADLVMVDLDLEQEVNEETTHSRFTSAFVGMRLRGWPVWTMVRGNVVFRDGQVLGKPGTGLQLTRGEAVAAPPAAAGA